MVYTKYGLGVTTQDNFKKIYGINLNKNVFVKKNVVNIFKSKTAHIKIEKDLFKKVQNNILFYKKLRNFRGNRHWRNLPVRGQRTHTNATKPKFRNPFI